MKTAEEKLAQIRRLIMPGCTYKTFYEEVKRIVESDEREIPERQETDTEYAVRELATNTKL